VRGLQIQIDDDNDDDFLDWRSGVWYIMTDGGIEKKYPNLGDDEILERMKQKFERKLSEPPLPPEPARAPQRPRISSATGTRVVAVGPRLILGVLSLLKLGH
jgi:hypothetical protein